MKNLFLRLSILTVAAAAVLIGSVTGKFNHLIKDASAANPTWYECHTTFNPSSLTTLTQTSTTVTCPGAQLGDYVEVSTSIDRALLTITGYVNAADTVTFLVFNGSAGSIDLASATFSAKVTPRYVSP